MEHRQPPGEPHSLREEYRAFFQKEYRPVVRFLLSAGATWEEAEDSAQEAMIRAFGNWPMLDSPSQWVHKVAWRCYVSSVRRERRRQTLEEKGARMHRGAADEYDHLAEHDWLIAILRSLPPRQREVLAWSLDGYRPQEIADLLDMEPATVRSNLRAVRTKLRQAPACGGAG